MTCYLADLHIVSESPEKALSWLTSYMTERTQLVKVANKHSISWKRLCGVPPGAVLGPVLYSTYTTPLAEIVRQHGLNFHFHADDTHLHLSFNLKATGDPMYSLSRVQSCISDITNWMASNKLMLNSDKTEILMLNACHRASSFTVVYYSSPWRDACFTCRKEHRGLVRWISINGQTRESSLPIGLLPPAQYH